MVELLVPSREPVTGNTEPRVRGSQAGRVGTKTWGISLWPHICRTGERQYLLWTGHQEEKELGEETVVLKLQGWPWGKDQPPGDFSLGS